MKYYREELPQFQQSNVDNIGSSPHGVKDFAWYNTRMGYTKAAMKGVSWIAILRILTRIVSFIKTIILARILVPSQFGAYGIALLVLGFLEVMTETGVNIILIQEKKTDDYINSAWVVSIIRGIIVSVFLIILTPFIVAFFRSPEAKELLYAVSIVPLLRGFINPSIVKLQKELNFSKEFWYRFIIFCVDTITAIVFTLATKSPIGIIIGLIAGVIVEIVLSYWIVKPLPHFMINGAYIKKIIHRGKWITISGICNYLFHSADKIIVGRFLGSAFLGSYQMAYSISMLPITEIADVFSRVTFPIYHKIVGDTARLRKAFLKTTLVVMLLTLPFGIIFVFFSKEIVLLLLGKRWEAIVPILPILGFFGVIKAISNSSTSLYLAVGKQEYVTIITFVSILGLIIPIIPLVMHFGLVGAALSALVGSLVAVPFIMYYTLKVLK